MLAFSAALPRVDTCRPQRVKLAAQPFRSSRSQHRLRPRHPLARNRYGPAENCGSVRDNHCSTNERLCDSAGLGSVGLWRSHLTRHLFFAPQNQAVTKYAIAPKGPGVRHRGRRDYGPGRRPRGTDSNTSRSAPGAISPTRPTRQIWQRMRAPGWRRRISCPEG